MKLTFLVCNSFFVDRAMKILHDDGIDYYTSCDNAKGKGHGTEPQLGAGAYGSTNTVLMIAFEDEAALEALVSGVTTANQEVRRAVDRIRLFQLPLVRIV